MRRSSKNTLIGVLLVLAVILVLASFTYGSREHLSVPAPGASTPQDDYRNKLIDMLRACKRGDAYSCAFYNVEFNKHTFPLPSQFRNIVDANQVGDSTNIVNKGDAPGGGSTWLDGGTWPPPQQRPPAPAPSSVVAAAPAPAPAPAPASYGTTQVDLVDGTKAMVANNSDGLPNQYEIARLNVIARANMPPSGTLVSPNANNTCPAGSRALYRRGGGPPGPINKCVYD
jgi:hypothetical protein